MRVLHAGCWGMLSGEVSCVGVLDMDAALVLLLTQQRLCSQCQKISCAAMATAAQVSPGCYGSL
jgi:hypothetical protein